MNLNKLLEKTITVRQILRFAVVVFLLLIVAYIPAYMVHMWNLEMKSIGFRDSPYYSVIPSECRYGATTAGDHGQGGHLLERLFFISPSTFIYSLPDLEKKLGYGMKGFPCMGYDFLMLLHGHDFSRVEKYLDENGNVVAVVTTEIIKPYRPPVPAEIWRNLPDWPEIGNPPANDASLVIFPEKDTK
jgi:hypothetical protein